MGQPEKDPANSPNPSDPMGASEKKEPRLDAILPDDLPPSAAELVDDIDNYQKRMEHDWEKAKSSYEQKINHIMEEFLRAGIAGMTNQETPPPPPTREKPKNFVPPKESGPTSKRSSTRDARLAQLMADMEQELKEASRKASGRMSFLPNNAPETLQIPWQGTAPRPFFKVVKVLAVVAVLAVGGFYGYEFTHVTVVPLPYTHALGPTVWNGQIYIMDWFRKALYVHENKTGMPVSSIENVPNNLASGIALSEKTLWTLDSLDKKILLHAATPDHQITSSLASPGEKPVGLFYDGLDLWSADQESRTLYRHRGNDLEDIRDTFPLPNVSVTSFAFYNNRLWILDGKSRLINVYRLQKPMRQLGSFDLDPFVKGAMPVGMAFLGKKILVVTENPPTLTRIPLFRLKKSKTESF